MFYIINWPNVWPLKIPRRGWTQLASCAEYRFTVWQCQGHTGGLERETRPTWNYTTTLGFTTLHYTTLHYTTLHYTTLHYTTLYYSALQYTILHYIILHYSALHQHFPLLSFTALSLSCTVIVFITVCYCCLLSDIPCCILNAIPTTSHTLIDTLFPIYE